MLIASIPSTLCWNKTFNRTTHSNFSKDSIEFGADNTSSVKTLNLSESFLEFSSELLLFNKLVCWGDTLIRLIIQPYVTMWESVCICTLCARFASTFNISCVKKGVHPGWNLNIQYRAYLKKWCSRDEGRSKDCHWILNVIKIVFIRNEPFQTIHCASLLYTRPYMLLYIALLSNRRVQLLLQAQVWPWNVWLFRFSFFGIVLTKCHIVHSTQHIYPLRV